LFTDLVNFSWCAGADGQVQVTPGSGLETPSVESGGLNFGGGPSDFLNALEISLLDQVAITFSASPPALPTVFENTVTASASFTEQFNAGLALVSNIDPAGKVVDRLAETLLPLLRHVNRSALGIPLSGGWSAILSEFNAWKAEDFGLPSWAADFVSSLPGSEVADDLADLSQEFVSSATTALQKLNQPTLTRVVTTLDSVIKQLSDALIFQVVLWQPRIFVIVSANPQPVVTVMDQGPLPGAPFYVEPALTTNKRSG
jgi:hypothetical protein